MWIPNISLHVVDIFTSLHTKGTRLRCVGGVFFTVHPQEIQSLLINWKGPDLTTYGELVLEGTFHVLRAKNTRTLFLFERMLLITKKRGEHYVYKIHISVWVFDTFDLISDLMDLKGFFMRGRRRRMMMLVCKRKGNKMLFPVKWIRDICLIR